MTDFTTKYRGERNIVKLIQHEIMDEVLEIFPEIKLKERDDLMDILYRISESTGERFFMIIDEWDAILREMGTDEFITTSYVDLLRRLFKGSGSNTVFAGAYLTGILGFKPPTKDINVTASLAILSIILIELSGVLAKGGCGWLETILKWLMEIINKFTKNWGVSIILMTILIKLIMFPFTKNQSLSTLKMQEILPKILQTQEDQLLLILYKPI